MYFYIFMLTKYIFLIIVLLKGGFVMVLSPDQEQRIVNTLLSGERLVDDVIAETGLTTGKILALLTMLELKGVVKRLPGKRITLK